ncbi:MAG: DUF1616 domain-containing protein [Haloarculaceae archaeon]
MTDAESTSSGRWTIGLPTDVVAALAFALAADAVLLAPGVTEAHLRALFGLPLLFFLPGYSLVAALYPARDQGVRFAGNRLAVDVPDVVERAALGLGASVALAPLFGLALWYAVGITAKTLALALTGFTVLGLAVAVVRRARLPADRRFGVRPRRWLARLRKGPGTLDIALNVALVVVGLLAVSSLGYAMVSPPSGGHHTEAMLLTENETGAYVAGGYPSSVQIGQPQPLVLGLHNAEGRTVEYDVVIQIQRVERSGTAVTVRNRSALRRLSATVPNGQTTYVEHRVTPDELGDDLRLTYLVYRGDVPAHPTSANAYRTTYLWLNVTR